MLLDEVQESLVQSSVQQNSSHECRAKILAPRREAFPTSLTEMTFKKRYDGHMTSMRHERMEKSTELSKLIWDMKRKNAGYSISLSVVAQTTSYSNATKRCPLCLREKLEILHADRRVNINKRSELVAKCRHKNKFYLSNFTPSVT